MYKLELNKKATKAFDKLPTYVITGFREKFRKLVENPYQMTGVETITNPKSIGLLVDKAYRIRVENYRAVYTINDEVITIYILDIEHRSKVYKKS